MNDSRQRNSQGQFAPEQQGGMDPNTTSAAYNPQIIEARKASLAEKLRRAIGIRRGVEESVPQEQRVLSAKLRLRELAAQAAQPPYVEEKKRSGIGKVGALGLGLGLGIGGAVAGVRYLRPVVSKAVNRAARNVTKGTQDVADAAKTAIPEAAEAVKKTAADAQDAMALGSDLGKAYKWAKSAVGGGLYNIRHPRQTMRETRGAFRAGVKEGQLRRAAKLAGKSKEEIEAIKVPYPKRARPAWALSAVLRLDRLKELAALSGRLVEFSKQEKEKLSTKQKIGVAAGLGAAALGASLLPASARLAAIQGREILHGVRQKAAATRGLQKFIKPPGVDANRGGRMVSDYIDASQAALNRGLHGRAAGAVLRYASENPGSLVAKKIGGDFKVSHYARFRAGHKQALGHWDWEVGELYKGKRLRPGRLEKIQDEMSRGRKAVEDEMNQEMWKGGKSEAEALRHVAANTKSADAQEYFNKLAMTKAGVAKDYAKMSLAAPGLVVAGASGAYAASRRKEKK